MLFFKKKRSWLKLKWKVLNIEIKKRFKQNPFALKRKRSFFSNIQNLITINITKKTLINIIIFFIILLILWIIFILFWPNFKIKNIEILNSDWLVNIDIWYDSLKDFRWKSILLLDKKEVTNSLIESQKNIKSVSIGMILPDKLKIILKSNKAIFNSKINGTNYLITQNWIAVPSNKQDPQLKNIEIKITNNFTDKIISYQKVIDEEYIKNITNIYNKIEDNILWIKIDEIKFYSIEKDIIIKINNWTLLIFSLEWDIDSQIEKLVQFNTENKDWINIKNDWISYIDLRIPEKVFLCKKETENNCKSNLVNIYWN